MRSAWQISFFIFRFLQLFGATAVLAFHSSGYSGYQTYINLVSDNTLESDFTPNALYFIWFIIAVISVIASVGLCFFSLAYAHRYMSSPSERKFAILMAIIWLAFTVTIMNLDGGFRDLSSVADVQIDEVQKAEAYVFWCWNFTCGSAIATLLFWIIGVGCMYLWLQFGNKGDRFIAEEDSDIYSPWRIPGASTPPLSSPSSRMASIASIERISPMGSPGSRSYKNPREYKTPRQVARLSMVSQQGSRPSTPMILTRPVSLLSVELNLNEMTARDGSIHSTSSSPVIGNPPSPSQRLAKSRRSSAPVLNQLANPSQEEVVPVEFMSEARDGAEGQQQDLGQEARIWLQRHRHTSTPELSRLVIPQQDESVSVEVVTGTAGMMGSVIRQQEQEMAEVARQEERKRTRSAL